MEFFGLFFEVFLFCFGCSTDPTITVLPEAHCPWILRLVRSLRHHFHLIRPHRGAEWETALLFPFASALVFPGPCSSSLLPPTTSLQGPGSQASPSACHISLVKCLLPPVPTDILNDCACYGINTSVALQLVCSVKNTDHHQDTLSTTGPSQGIQCERVQAFRMSSWWGSRVW